MECNDFKKSASVAGTAREYPPAVKGGAPMAGHRDSTCEVAVMDNYTTTCLDLEDRTSLYRVAALAQELWLIYREIMWIHFDIERIEKSDNGLSMFGTVSETSPRSCPCFIVTEHLCVSNPWIRCGLCAITGFQVVCLITNKTERLCSRIWDVSMRSTG